MPGGGRAAARSVTVSSSIGRAVPVDECRLCGGPHEPAIHEAVLSVHRWLRARELLVMASRLPRRGAPMRKVG